MKKSQLRELVREVVRGGRSDYYPGVETPGLTPDVFNTILKNVALGKKYSDEENSEKEKIRRGNLAMNKGDVKTGHKILDRGNPNIPLDEAEGKQYSKQELIDYLDNLSPEMEVAIPQIHMSGNFDFNAKWRTTAAKAAQALSDTSKEGEFTLSQDNPTYKSFSLVQSPEELEKRTKFMQDFGGLD